MIMITKASDYNYYDFTNETDVTQLFKKYNDFIFILNRSYGIDISLFPNDMDEQTKHNIINSKYELKIYDDYVE